MCDKAVEASPFGPYSLANVPDCFKTEDMCIKAVEKCTWLLKYVTDRFKTQEICNEAVPNHP